jgi:hypothetical protein
MAARQPPQTAEGKVGRRWEERDDCGAHMSLSGREDSQMGILGYIPKNDGVQVGPVLFQA